MRSGIGSLLLLMLAVGCGSVSSGDPDASDGTVIDGAPPSGDASCLEETVDQVDNDCDDEVDEGFWTTVFVTPHAVLAAQDPGCDGKLAIEGNPYQCQLAVNRECIDRGYQAGYRPIEVDGTDVGFSCISDVRPFTVSYAQLQEQVAGCDPASAFLGACFTAIKRFCQEGGFALGIGPLNDDPSAMVDLVCTDHADYAALTFDELRTADADCDLPDGAQPWDFPCFRAYHRHCWMSGVISAWGPAEYDVAGENVHVACLPAGPP